MTQIQISYRRQGLEKITVTQWNSRAHQYIIISEYKHIPQFYLKCQVLYYTICACTVHIFRPHTQKHTGTAASQHTQAPLLANTHTTHTKTHTHQEKNTHTKTCTTKHTHTHTKGHFHYQNLLKLSKGSAYIQLCKTKTCHLHSPMCAILFGYFICFGANQDHKAKNTLAISRLKTVFTKIEKPSHQGPDI